MSAYAAGLIVDTTPSRRVGEPTQPRLPVKVPYQPDALLIGLAEGDMEKHLNSRWRRWRFRNRPDYFKIARMEERLGLEPTTDPEQWEI